MSSRRPSQKERFGTWASLPCYGCRKARWDGDASSSENSSEELASTLSWGDGISELNHWTVGQKGELRSKSSDSQTGREVRSKASFDQGNFYLDIILKAGPFLFRTDKDFEISTVLRLLYNALNSCLWADDACAGLAMLSSLGWLVCFWVRTDMLGTVLSGQPAFTGSIVIWMDDILALAVVWLSRMSFILSLVRISPPRLSIVRKLPFLESMLFLLMWGLLLAERIYYFHGRTSSGMDTEGQQFWGEIIRVTVLASETISNVVMAVTLTFRVMAGSAIGVHRRRLLLLLFSGLTIVVATSIIHTVFWVHGSAPLRRDLTAIIQVKYSFSASILHHLGKYVQPGLSLIFADFAVAAIRLCRTYSIAYPGHFGVEVSRSPVIHLNETRGRQIGLQCRTPQTGNLVRMGLQTGFDSKSHTSKVEDSAKVLPEVNLQMSVSLTQITQRSCIGAIEPSSSKSLPAAAIAKDAGNPAEPCMEGTSCFAAWVLVSTLFPSLRANGFRKGAHQSNLEVDPRDWGVGAFYVVLLLDLQVEHAGDAIRASRTMI
ncbi:hypothetical protein EDD18DRAFT_1107283 [Armillaria luteobubalina]|uniref:Uncharacterized protein n=1 Tax=Armillaria luteobubalina TaxID=153913 RepID=A0AA39Q2M2_9AGAR|nr:hypothetical protein EDD18DRAFT_1107283 [Armillaria luteobubalina]